ncbi:MAG: hypothetical protein K2X90_02670 [Candidatus Babeliaceae bacterium]|nr:hypothetical protein [Candidatus Babeliaceae bacterium]
MNIKNLFFFSLCVLSAITSKNNIIYLDWFGEELRNDKLFTLVGGGDEWRQLKTCLKRKGYDITTHRYRNDESELFYGTHFDMPGDVKQLLKQYSNKLAVFLWEPPSVKPENFNKKLHENIPVIFTWSDDLIDNHKYFKFFYPQPKTVKVEKVPYLKKKFCCTMVANKQSNHPKQLYGERLKTILFFEKVAPKLFDLYGPGWQTSKLTCYKGFVNDKFNTLAKYKFCICYENIKDIPGYVSEKIHHCLLTGCVPVYWGASNINDYIPAECFIDRRKFASNKELFEFLRSMTQEEYQEYLDAAQKYLFSTQQLLFSDLYFADCLLKGFISDYNRSDFFDSNDMRLLEKIDRIQQKIILKSYKG